MKNVFLLLASITVMTLFYMSECDSESEKANKEIANQEETGEKSIMNDPGVRTPSDTGQIGTGDIDNIVVHMQNNGYPILEIFINSGVVQHKPGILSEATAADPAPDSFNNNSYVFVLRGIDVIINGTMPRQQYTLQNGTIWVQLTGGNSIKIYQRIR